MKKYLKRTVYIKGNHTFTAFTKTVNGYFTKVQVTVTIDKDVFTDGETLNGLLDNWGRVVSEKVIAINCDEPKNPDKIFTR